MEFKTGDRVKCIKQWGGNIKCVGKIGTIINRNSTMKFDSASVIKGVSVEFDEFVEGNSGFDFSGKKGFCWCFPNSTECLELVQCNKIIINQYKDKIFATLFENEIETKCVAAICNKNKECAFDFETGAKLALERLFENTIEVGDKVKVTDEAYIYQQYTRWIEKYAKKYSVYFCFMTTPQVYIEEKTYTVVAKAPHEDFDRMLYLIQDDDNCCYLLDEKGIKKVQR